MTRTQLQEMSDRELVGHTRDYKLGRGYLRELLDELANRLDDRYPFNPEPETTGFIQEV